MNLDGDNLCLVLLRHKTNICDFVVRVSADDLLVSNLFVDGIVDVLHIGDHCVVDHRRAVFRQLDDCRVWMALCARSFCEARRNLGQVDWQWLVFSSVAEPIRARHSIARTCRLLPDNAQSFGRLAPARTLIAGYAASAGVVTARLAREQIQSDASSNVKLQDRRVFHDRHGLAECNVTKVDAIAAEYLIARSQTRLAGDAVFFCELHEYSRLPVGAFADSEVRIKPPCYDIVVSPFLIKTHPHPSLVRGATFSKIRTSFGVASSWLKFIDEFNGTTCQVNGSVGFLRE